MHLTIGQARDHIQAMFEAGVEAADPETAIKNTIHFQSGRLVLNNCQTAYAQNAQRSDAWNRVHIVAFGKAACKMAATTAEIIPSFMQASKGMIVTNEENKQNVDGFIVHAAGHPLPDQRGVTAAKCIEDKVKTIPSGDLVLILISGGGSSLIPYPVPTITLDDKIITTQLLLASGAVIDEINCVRKHISQLKGGHLARLAHPVDLHALILSDVIGDDPGTIASGPTVPDSTTFDDAIKVLTTRKIWTQTPQRVRKHLLSGSKGIIAETPKSTDILFNSTGYTLISSNTISVSAMQGRAEQSGFKTDVYSTKLCGEARKEAVKLCRYAAQKLSFISVPTAVIAGGETTVTLTGRGTGGRNQEFALAFALAAEQMRLEHWVFLSAGTDGRDGPTDAAGAIVDADTLCRIRACGKSPADYLNDNDSYHALKLSGNLLMTGSTGTNVADLQIVLLFPDHA